MDIKFLTTPLSSQADFSSNALCTFRKMAYFFFNFDSHFFLHNVSLFEEKNLLFNFCKREQFFICVAKTIFPEENQLF